MELETTLNLISADTHSPNRYGILAKKNYIALRPNELIFSNRVASGRNRLKKSRLKSIFKNIKIGSLRSFSNKLHFKEHFLSYSMVKIVECLEKKNQSKWNLLVRFCYRQLYSQTCFSFII